MGWLKLMIRVTPYLYDKEMDDAYYADTLDIREWLVERMIKYLQGYAIRLNNETAKITHAIARIPHGSGASMRSVMHVSDIRKEKHTYVTSITFMSQHASWVEFGTGMRGELPGSGLPIVPKRKKVLHWIDTEGEHFFASVRGQYPKPFMRAAINGLSYKKELYDGYVVDCKIEYPRKAKYDRIMRGRRGGK